MKQLTEKQKAAIYDDAVEELRHRIKVITSENVIQQSMYNSGYTDGAVQAYKQSLELLNAPDMVDYAKRTWKDNGVLIGFAVTMMAFIAIGAFVEFMRYCNGW